MSLSPTTTSFLTTQTDGLKSRPFKLQPNGWRSTKMSMEHNWELIIIAGCEVMPRNNHTAFAKARQHRSSTICAVVERPHHHCGDDLVSHLKVWGLRCGMVISTYFERRSVLPYPTDWLALTSVWLFLCSPMSYLGSYQTDAYINEGYSNPRFGSFGGRGCWAIGPFDIPHMGSY